MSRHRLVLIVLALLTLTPDGRCAAQGFGGFHGFSDGGVSRGFGGFNYSGYGDSNEIGFKSDRAAVAPGFDNQSFGQGGYTRGILDDKGAVVASSGELVPAGVHLSHNQLNDWLGISSEDHSHSLSHVSPGEAALHGSALIPTGNAANVGRVAPSVSSQAGSAVRASFHRDQHDFYDAAWYRRYPHVWRATNWAAGTAWNSATWDSLRDYLEFDSEQPVNDDHGDYDQAASLAVRGGQVDAPADADWLPLGVFALTKSERLSSNLVLQLAVNKQGVVRGNYTDTATGHTEVVHGSIDKASQRVAFVVGSVKSTVIETDLANLTDDELPAQMHFGSKKNEPWLLIRLKR